MSESMQAGLLAKELVENWFNENGYSQSKLVPGLWKHDWRPIHFSLVVDNFGIKTLEKNMLSTWNPHLNGTIRSSMIGPAIGILASRWIGIMNDNKFTCPCRATCKMHSNNSNTNQLRKKCAIFMCTHQLWGQKSICCTTIDSATTRQERQQIYTTSL